jgi:16S rRNA (cytosine967-C5)-methyltransferase
VQDRAARTAVEIAAPKPGMKVLDACSSPGGKSFATAIAMSNQGAILSCDIHEKKLNLVQSGAQRLGIDIISTEARDARENVDEFHDAFDLVIADVPCSGLGVIRKKPEIRNKDFDSLTGLPIIQRDIINNLASFVKPGGTLMYSTCTVLEEENEAIVADFLANRPDFVLQSFSVAGINCDSGMYTFWPNVDGTDGFFAAKLIRKK